MRWTLRVMSMLVLGSVVLLVPAAHAHAAGLTITITGKPLPVTKLASAPFRFSSSRSGTTFTCSIDGGAFKACTSGKSYSGLASRSHTFKVHGVAGTRSGQATYTWLVDRDSPPAPTVESDRLLVFGKWANQSVALTASGSDPLSGVKRFEHRVMGPADEVYGVIERGSGVLISSDVEGANLVQFRTVDNAGNMSDWTDFEVDIDITGPVVTFDQAGKVLKPGAMLTGTVVDSGIGSIGDVAISEMFGGQICSDSPAGETWSCYAYGLDADGEYPLFLQPHDALGNQGGLTATITIDSVAATSTFAAPADPTAGTITFEGTVTDAHETDVAVQFTRRGKTITACDATVANPAADGDWSCTWDPEDDGVGDGPITMTAHTVDVAGNELDAATVDVSVDNNAPRIIVAPLRTNVRGTITTWGAVVDAFSGSTLTVTVDAELEVCTFPAMSVEQTWTCDIDTAAYDDGAHAISFAAVDAAGNERLLPPYSIMIDNTAPVVYAPTYASTLTKVAAITLETPTPTDNNSTAFIYQRRTALWSGGECEPSFGPWITIGSQDIVPGPTQSIATELPVPGCYQYRISMGDLAGNSSLSDPGPVVPFDGTKPVITFTAVNNVPHSTVQTITGYVSDDGIGADMSTFTFEWEGGGMGRTPVTCTITDLSFSCEFTPGGNNSGNFHVYANVDDLAGNSATELMGSFDITG